MKLILESGWTGNHLDTREHFVSKYRLVKIIQMMKHHQDNKDPRHFGKKLPDI